MSNPDLNGQTIYATLRRTAARQPTKLAVKDGDLSWNYARFNDWALRIAAGIVDLGIRPGDRVAILSRNSAAFAATRYALSAMGGILVPINFMLNVKETAYILNHSGAKVLFIGPDELTKAEQLRSACIAVEHIVWMGNQTDIRSSPGVLSIDQVASAAPYLSTASIDSALPAQIIYTSGTESAPKGAVLSHSAVIWQYGSCLVDAEVAYDDVMLHSMPLYHCAQLDCFLGPSIQVGGTNIITDDPSPDNLLRLLERERVNSFFAPPTVWISLLNSSRFQEADLSALQKGYYGASTMPVEVIKKIQRSMPQIRLWNLYGQTEIAPVATILKPEDQMRKLGSAGKPVLHVETRIVDDAGLDVADGEIGEVVHRSPQLLTRYYNDPERTAAAFKGGWFHSGDLAIKDSEGYITIVDRKKDMIKSGGENISGREVEEAIYLLDGVAEVAVVGVSHPKWIEGVLAVISVSDVSNLTEKGVIQHCARHLGGFKIPKKVLFVAELPRNPSGKILKRDLRDCYQEIFYDT
ncbi:MAG: fatty-acyl-CoA synthase [Halieaceae bacterium]|jgi:fatty-acyl-CoA synthase